MGAFSGRILILSALGFVKATTCYHIKRAIKFHGLYTPYWLCDNVRFDLPPSTRDDVRCIMLVGKDPLYVYIMIMGPLHS